MDKNPGIRPIEVCRRIVSKSILMVLKPDIVECVGCLQLCGGLEGGCEAAAHAISQLFQSDETEGVLLVNATNAFNSLN